MQDFLGQREMSVIDLKASPYMSQNVKCSFKYLVFEFLCRDIRVFDQN